MYKSNINPSQRPINSNQTIYTSATTSSRTKKVKKSGCGCGKNKKKS